MWKGPDKQQSIKLPADLHAEVKLEALKRGITTAEAYVEGMTAWLKGKPDPQFPNLTASERRTLRGLLVFLRIQAAKESEIDLEQRIMRQRGESWYQKEPSDPRVRPSRPGSHDHHDEL